METKENKKPGVVKRIFRPMVTGALTIFPLVVTLLVIIWLVQFLEGYLGPGSNFGKLLESIGLNFVTSKLFAYFIGLVVALALIYLFGLMVEIGLRNRWNSFTDRVMNRIPVVKTIYDAARKLIKLLDSKDSPELKAMVPVMCYFGGKGGTAVLALLTSREKIAINGHEYYSVMIPSSPVPIGGAILYVPVGWVEFVDMGIDGLINVYVSMGVTGPDLLRKKENSP